MKMKRILALLLLPCLLLGSMALSGCSQRITYENGKNYAVGAFESAEKINAVEIYWDGRAVSVIAAFTDKIRAEEDYFEEDGKAMRYAIEEGVLKIYPCASGKRVGKLSKTLFLQIPMEMANALSSVTVHAYDDTKVSLQMMQASKTKVLAEDGNVSIDGSLSSVYVETVKGDLTLKSATLADLEFVSEIGNANLSLHLQGFTAVMREGKGTFESEYAVSENNGIYAYGTQATLISLLTEGKVTLDDFDILG